jgi:hypothetical protein
MGSAFSVAEEAVDINPSEAVVFASILLMMQRQQGQIELWQGNCASSSSQTISSFTRSPSSASGPPPAKELVNDGFAFVRENYAEYSPTPVSMPNSDVILSRKLRGCRRVSTSRSWMVNDQAIHPASLFGADAVCCFIPKLEIP